MPIIVVRHDKPGSPRQVITNDPESLGRVAELDGEHVVFTYPDGRKERIHHKDVRICGRAMGLHGHDRWIGQAMC